MSERPTLAELSGEVREAMKKRMKPIPKTSAFLSPVTMVGGTLISSVPSEIPIHVKESVAKEMAEKEEKQKTHEAEMKAKKEEAKKARAKETRAKAKEQADREEFRRLEKLEKEVDLPEKLSAKLAKLKSKYGTHGLKNI